MIPPPVAATLPLDIYPLEKSSIIDVAHTDADADADADKGLSYACHSQNHELESETHGAQSPLHPPSLASSTNGYLPQQVNDSITNRNNTTNNVISSNSTASSHNNINFNTTSLRKTSIPPSRPTRESVLRRLSEALMRRSLTMIDISQRGLISSDARLVKLALLQNSSLSILKLGYNNLGNDGVATLASGIAKHGALTSIDLGFNNVGDEGCISLANSILSVTNNKTSAPGLHTLYLAGNCIREEGAIALANILRTRCGLRRLHLTGNKVGADGIKSLMEAIIEHDTGDASVHSNLTTTKINTNNTINSKPAHTPGNKEGEKCNIFQQQNNTIITSTTTSAHTKKNERIEELFLGGTDMGHIGCVAVGTMLQHSTSLRVLSLANCDLNDEDGNILAQSIAKNRDKLPLEALQLSFNNFTCKGIEPLMNAVWGSKTLTEVRIDNNSIGDRGAHVVSAVLTSVPTLKKLDLGFNSITANGMRILMKAVAENLNLHSLSISGNKVDTGSAKAVAYALAYNKSLKSLFLDHCSIGNEGQRHITAGIVSNSHTLLHTLTGFLIGSNAVSLGLPSALSNWSNDQVLKFILLMWEGMRREQEIHAQDKELDPLHLLPGVQGNSNHKLFSGPLDPATVVSVAKQAFESLGENSDEVLSRQVDLNAEPNFESPLTEDAIMLEADGEAIDGSDQAESSEPIGMDDSISISGHRTPPIPNGLITISKTTPLSPTLDALSRKELIVEWLCHNIHHLNELSQLPFNSSELWRLHQHFFNLAIQESGAQCSTDSSCVVESAEYLQNRASCTNQGSSILSEPFAVLPSMESTDEQMMPASEPALNASLGTLPLLKRKVSYRFLHEACLTSTMCPKIERPNHLVEGSVSRLIEDMNGQSMQPKSKRARRNLSRISFLPRIKTKLDSFLDSCHHKALVLMRQLQYVEKSLLNRNIYPLDGLGNPTHLSGKIAADVEAILLDMM